MNRNHVVFIIIGGVVGGVTGYLTASLLIYKLAPEYEELAVSEEKDEWILEKDANPSLSKRDYSKMVNQVDKGRLEDLVAPYKSSLEIVQPPKKEKGVPMPDFMVISEDQFRDGLLPKRVVYYYAQDGKYTDIGDDLMENASELLENAHLHFGEMTDDPDTVYYRNNILREDFEVIKIDDSYDRAVLGIQPEPPTPKRAHKPRAKPKPEIEEEEDDN